MRIGIVGTGAVASYLAGRLATVSDVVMVGRWQAHMVVIQQNGLTLIEQDGKRRTTHIEIIDQWDEDQITPVDVVLVVTKTYQEASALERAKAIAGSDTPIVLMWNGLSVADSFHTQFPGRVINAILLVAAYIDPDRLGTVQHTGGDTIQFGLSDAQRQQLYPMIALLEATGINAPIFSEHEIEGLRWSKTIINAAINPLTALLVVPNGFLVETPYARQMMVAAAQEAQTVALALGIALPLDDYAAEVIRIAQLSAKNYASMLTDIQRGSQTEIDAITLPIIEAGKRLGILTPINKILYRAIKNECRMRISEE